MISGNQVKKLLLMASFVIIAIYTGLPRIQSVSNGLPYHHFWDEPATATGALIAVKTNKLIRKNRFELEREINILSGLLSVKINQSGVGLIIPKPSPLWGTVKNPLTKIKDCMRFYSKFTIINQLKLML